MFCLVLFFQIKKKQFTRSFVNYETLERNKYQILQLIVIRLIVHRFNYVIVADSGSGRGSACGSCIVPRASCTAGRARDQPRLEKYTLKEMSVTFVCYLLVAHLLGDHLQFVVASLLVCLDRRCVDETKKLSSQERVPMLVLLPYPAKYRLLLQPLLSSPLPSCLLHLSRCKIADLCASTRLAPPFQWGLEWDTIRAPCLASGRGFASCNSPGWRAADLPPHHLHTHLTRQARSSFACSRAGLICSSVLSALSFYIVTLHLSIVPGRHPANLAARQSHNPLLHNEMSHCFEMV